jgi:hypothetical protein
VKLENDKTLMLRCGCHSHLLEIYNNGENFFEVVIWRSYPKRESLWERLRLCWRVICHKNLLLDDMVLDDIQAKEAIDFLNRQLEENRSIKINDKTNQNKS